MKMAATTDAAVIVRLYQSFRIGSTKAQPYARTITTLSVVSSSDMPAVNSAGNTRIVQTDMPCAAWVADMPRRPISVAVSNPRPNSRPIGYMCQERKTTRKIGRNRRVSTPCPSSSASSAASRTASPPRARMKADQTPRRMNRLAMPMTNRNSADTSVPNALPPGCSGIVPVIAAIVMDASTTTVECPSEKKNPTLYGVRPSWISLRTALSMAAMWSASNACRSPNT